MMLSFACYLQPPECDQLTAMQVAPPVAAGAAGEGLAALLLCPGELGGPGRQASGTSRWCSTPSSS
eukprot:6051283-Pyramimonas_sp.AAC.1